MRIFPPVLSDNFKEPALECAATKVHLPPICTVLRVLEKLKAIDHNLYVIATRNGHLRLKLTTDTVSTGICFDDDDPEDDDLTVVQVDIRDFIKALSCEVFNPTSVVLGLYKTGVCSLLVGATVEQNESEIARMNYYVPNKDQD